MREPAWWRRCLVLGLLLIAGLTCAPPAVGAVERGARHDAGAFARVTRHSADVIGHRFPLFLRRQEEVVYVLAVCRDALGDDVFGSSPTVNVVASSMQAQAIIGPVHTPLRVFGDRLVAVHAHDRVLNRSARAWRDLARVGASFPTLPYDSACATFTRWGAHYAVTTAPLNIARIKRLFARIQRDRLAIAHSTRPARHQERVESAPRAGGPHVSRCLWLLNALRRPLQRRPERPGLLKNPDAAGV